MNLRSWFCCRNKREISDKEYHTSKEACSRMNIPMNVKTNAKGLTNKTNQMPPAIPSGRGKSTSSVPHGGHAAHAKVSAASESPSSSRQPSRGWTELPSSRLKNVKCADPFASKASEFKTKFGSVFNAGGIPCRLNHGAVNIKLQWSKDPRELDYDPLLIVCAEGLSETQHPYAFAARACFEHMLAAEGSSAKTTPLVPRIIPCLRAALLSPNKNVFAGAVEAATQLSEVVGEAMNPHIHNLVMQMNKKSSDRDLSPKILKAMQTFEEFGGAEALKVIKSKVPTYCSIHI
uniref:Uncharacterized protein n=2 Tax=Guillardia theta TaxID=55529 RepID=A0A7S4K1J5_GUITH|mmetsp:Transcript_20361/g.68014  ORF Transcript_20361/g.68014 Transcript_20361/m.68014 type:complete len:290 (+) Transcript_20361:342-1211(+)